MVWASSSARRKYDITYVGEHMWDVNWSHVGQHEVVIVCGVDCGWYIYIDHDGYWLFDSAAASRTTAPFCPSWGTLGTGSTNTLNFIEIPVICCCKISGFILFRGKAKVIRNPWWQIWAMFIKIEALLWVVITSWLLNQELPLFWVALVGHSLTYRKQSKPLCNQHLRATWRKLSRNWMVPEGILIKDVYGYEMIFHS